MACHAMQTHRHRREANLHFLNSFMEKSLLPFLTANDRDDHSLERTRRCSDRGSQRDELPAVHGDRARLDSAGP